MVGPAYGEERRSFSQRSVEVLLKLLASDDLRTRFIAEMCLRDATGT